VVICFIDNDVFKANSFFLFSSHKGKGKDEIGAVVTSSPKHPLNFYRISYEHGWDRRFS
jgi:hypothetical protein